MFEGYFHGKLSSYFSYVGQFVICPRKATNAALHSGWVPPSSCFHQFCRQQTHPPLKEKNHKTLKQFSFSDRIFWVALARLRPRITRRLKVCQSCQNSCVYDCDDSQLQTGKRWRTMISRLLLLEIRRNLALASCTFVLSEIGSCGISFINI